MFALPISTNEPFSPHIDNVSILQADVMSGMVTQHSLNESMKWFSDRVLRSILKVLGILFPSRVLLLL